MAKSFTPKPVPFPRELTPAERLDRAQEIAAGIVVGIVRDAARKGLASPSDAKRSEMQDQLAAAVESSWVNQRLDALEKRLAAIDGL